MRLRFQHKFLLFLVVSISNILYAVERKCLAAIRGEESFFHDSESFDPHFTDDSPPLHPQLKELAQSTQAFQEEMRKRWETRRKKEDEEDVAYGRDLTVSSRFDIRKATMRAHIKKIIDDLPRSDSDKKKASEVLETLLKKEPGFVKDFDLWLEDVQGRSPEDKNNMIFEAVQAEAMIRNNPNFIVDMGVDVDAKTTAAETGHTDKSLDLFVYDEDANVFFKVEVKSIQSRSKPYDAIGSFVAKSVEVSAKEPNPTLKMLALYTDFPAPRDTQKGIREVVDEFGILRRYRTTPEGASVEIGSPENLVLSPVKRSIEGHEKNGSTNVIFGIDALDRASTARQQYLRGEGSWTENQDHWDRQTFTPRPAQNN